MKKIIRKYRMPDGTMLTAADVFHKLYLIDVTDFQNFSNSFFYPSYAADFLTAIDAARTVVRDSVIINEQAEETQQVTLKMKEAMKHFKQMRFFIERAFPANETVWNQFGYNDYKAASRSKNKMLLFLEILYTTAHKYTAPLTAKGYTTAQITQIITLQEELLQEQLDQKQTKKNRPKLTQERIRKMNAPWGKIMDIHYAAKLMYQNNTAKVKQYAIRASL